MNSKELIQAGRLQEAREKLVGEVKASPGDPAGRTLLFQVLALLGEWDKAARHLDMIGTSDPARAIHAQTCRNLILAEKERIEVCSLKQLPSFLPETPGYFEPYREALKSIQAGDGEKAAELFSSIERPAVSGTVNDKPFEGISDTDTFLHAFLEAFVHERYVWIPFEHIRELIVAEPKTLLDLIWIQAGITTWEGLSLNCFLPVLYPGSFLHENDQIRLGRLTQWSELCGSFLKGHGQHVYQIGQEDVSLLEIRTITCKLK